MENSSSGLQGAWLVGLKKEKDAKKSASALRKGIISSFNVALVENSRQRACHIGLNRSKH